VYARGESLLLLLLADLEPDLDQDDSIGDDLMLERRTQAEKPLVLRFLDKTHDVLDAGAVVPAAIEDHDLTRCWKMLDVALHEHLRFLPIRGSRKCHDSEHARTDAFSKRLDRPALAGGVTPLEDDDDP